MRCLIKAPIPVAAGNAATANGPLASTIGSILTDVKPEAVYFAPENGDRTAFLLNTEHSSQIPAMCEPWFLAFNAPQNAMSDRSIRSIVKASRGSMCQSLQALRRDLRGPTGPSTAVSAPVYLYTLVVTR